MRDITNQTKENSFLGHSTFHSMYSLFCIMDIACVLNSRSYCLLSKSNFFLQEVEGQKQSFHEVLTLESNYKLRLLVNVF